MCTVACPKCARAQLQQLTTPTRVALIGIDMMAFQCSLCQYFSPSLALHVSHLRLVHSRDPSFYLMCGIDSCLEEFRTFSSFNSHVYRCHRIALGLEKPEKESIVRLVFHKRPTKSLQLKISLNRTMKPHTLSTRVMISAAGTHHTLTRIQH